MGDVDKGAGYGEEQGPYGKSLYILFNAAMNLKLF